MREAGTSEGGRVGWPAPGHGREPGGAAAASARPVRALALWTTLALAGVSIAVHAVGLSTLGSEEAAGSTARPATASGIETGSLPTIYRVDPAHCVSLELDRLASRTVVRPCPSDGLVLRLDDTRVREDLAVLADYDLR